MKKTRQNHGAPALTRIAALVASSAFASLLAPAVHAQQAAAPAPAGPSTQSADATNLERIVITATSQAKSKLRSSVSVTDVDQEQIKNFGARTEAEVMLLIPGIRTDATAGPGGNANISVRGLPIASGGSKYVQLQEDGLPTVQFGDMNFSNNDYWIRFDNNVDSIQTLRGGSSSVFASHAPGAVHQLHQQDRQAGRRRGRPDARPQLRRDPLRRQLRRQAGAGPVLPLRRLLPPGRRCAPLHRQRAAGLSVQGQPDQGVQRRQGLLPRQLQGARRACADDAADLPHRQAERHHLRQLRADAGLRRHARLAVLDLQRAPCPASTRSRGSARQHVAARTASRSTPSRSASSSTTSWPTAFPWTTSSASPPTPVRSRRSSGTSRLSALSWARRPTRCGSSTARWPDRWQRRRICKTGLVSNSAAINTQTPDMGNLVNDLSVSKQFKLDAATLDLRGGLFFSRQNVVQRWMISERVVEVGRNGAVLDVFDDRRQCPHHRRPDRLQQPVGWCCARDIDATFTTTAPYAALSAAVGESGSRCGRAPRIVQGQRQLRGRHRRRHSTLTATARPIPGAEQQRVPDRPERRRAAWSTTRSTTPTTRPAPTTASRRT